MNKERHCNKKNEGETNKMEEKTKKKINEMKNG